MKTAMMGPMTAMPAMGTTGGMTMPAATPTANCLMVPRCAIKMEKCAGGMKINCACDDQMACAALQSLCSSLAGSMCSCCCMMNGMVVCCCNLTMGMCRCEMTKDGVCITCTSGDKDCCAMIQSCCDSMGAMMAAGCTCCVMMNSMPVCCC
jgi:hypothetical protein